ncbi:MAG TPA: Smr/MutS family protein [Polyangia bacterium]|nr:Smr/MutS family protein [Polyangia bacterium]
MAAGSSDSLIERSRAALDWPEVLAELAARAQSPEGRAACLALPSFDDADEARAHMAAVDELASVLRRGENLPSLAVPEVEGILAAAEKGLVLGPEDVRPIADLCGVAEGVRRFFDDGEERGRAPLPAASARAADVDAHPMLARLLRETFDGAGEIRDSVSPTLARLRRERAQLADGARAAIEDLMRGEELAPFLQDRYVTVREDRYVLPVKASAKSMGLGIVHDTSRTGETVYVEPMALVAANNRIKVAELEIRGESRRILEDLSARVATAASSLRASAEALVALDVLAAQARLGVAYDGRPVEVPDAAEIDLRQVRHPLLALRAAREKFRLVANDVALGVGRGARILVVSGPNAGGKTVLLKSTALAALLVRAGMLVPAEPGSRVGFFAAVLADIGDQQSVIGDLSTFSGHLTHVAEILRHRQAVNGPTLVLLDELMAGTNPDQGAALARATAEALAEGTGVAVLTTHYDSLKALADGDARFANAGMEYDLTHLRPTFRLSVGTPGRSYALDIATRMGLPAALIERARALAGAASVGLEAAIATLEAREAEVAEEARRLGETRASLAESENVQREAAAALERRERELSRHSRAAIDESVREAREAMRAIVRDAQRAGTPQSADEAREAVERVAREALGRLPRAPDKPAPEKPPALEVGARVFVPSLGAEGVVTRGLDTRGRVRVSVGALSLEVAADELGKGAAAAKAKRGGVTTPALRGSGPDELQIAIQTPNNTVDVRGQRADEGLRLVEAYLDRAALDGNSPLFVIHGHGTGALRKEIRAYLARSPYVARWAPGEPRQGGDGVTVVELR